GEDDRTVARLPNEFVERGGHIAVGEIERLLGIFALQQECAERGLAVARRPDLTSCGESARLALGEQARTELGVAARVERAVPAVTLEIGWRMDVEDGSAAGRRWRRAVGQP